MSDLIRRIDAMQACQVAPSDEWSKATKGGYNQAATDCAMALLKCEPVPPTLSAAMELPEVKALLEATSALIGILEIASVLPTATQKIYIPRMDAPDLVQARAALAAADTRTVTVAQLEAWIGAMEDWDEGHAAQKIDEIRAIIGDTE